MSAADTKTAPAKALTASPKAIEPISVAPAGDVALESKDHKKFTVSKKDAWISGLARTSLESDAAANELPVPSVTGSVLELIVMYMKEHKGVEPPIIEKPLRSKVMKDVAPHKWDADFIDKVGENKRQLYDLILAANYMDIKSLLHLGSAKVASMIKGQPLEKIKSILDPNAQQTAVAGSAGAPAAAGTVVVATAGKDQKDQKG